ncbi:MAG: hypothetical protein U9O84_00600 [Chloroflexota bacterium]|nr:hypothetical protein [Chloroflexota bacterium]
MDKETFEKEGWKLASTSSGEHLKRTLEMYKELGFDIYTEEVTPGEYGGCTIYYQTGKETLTRTYSRPKTDDDIF